MPKVESFVLENYFNKNRRETNRVGEQDQERGRRESIKEYWGTKSTMYRYTIMNPIFIYNSLIKNNRREISRVEQADRGEGTGR